LQKCPTQNGTGETWRSYDLSKILPCHLDANSKWLHFFHFFFRIKFFFAITFEEAEFFKEKNFTSEESVWCFVTIGSNLEWIMITPMKNRVILIIPRTLTQTEKFQLELN
jgi:hypothetical protein